MNRLVTLAMMTVVLGVVGAADRAAAATIYVNEATFMSAAGTLGFESFEALAASNTVAGGFSRSLAAFTITGSPQAGVFDQLDYLGTHATDGTKYIEIEGGGQQTITFLFGAPITEFGVTITDYGDVIAGAMTFVTNAGGSGMAAVGARPNANDQFFGFIDSANPFASLTLSTAAGPFGDPFSVDRVRFSAPPSGNAVPEPGSMLLVGSGLAAALRRLKNRRNVRA